MSNKTRITTVVSFCLMEILLSAANSAGTVAPTRTYPAPGPLTAGQQVVQKFDSLGSTWVYLVYLPTTYDSDPSRKWATILYFPVAGATYDGSEFTSMTTNGYGPSRYLAAPSTCKFISDSFIVITPWLSGSLNSCWTAPANDAYFWAFLTPMINHMLKSSGRVDPARIHTMGYCYGAGIALKYFSRYPGIPASMSQWSVGGNIAACINDTDGTAACIYKNMPMQWFHNAPDPYSNWHSAQAAITLIRACGNNQLLWNLSQTGAHESWWATDTVKALYTWMLAQKQSATTAVARQSGNHRQTADIRSLAPGRNLPVRLEAGTRLDVVDVRGKRISWHEGNQATANRSVPSLSPGVYIIKMSVGGQSTARRIMMK